MDTLGPGRYVVRDGRDLLGFAHWDDIPSSFDNLITFLPDYPPGPHSHEEHDEMSVFNDKLREIMGRERRSKCRQSRALETPTSRTVAE